jgi:pimeloyl-ACP methyl ester carboxylesterase
MPFDRSILLQAGQARIAATRAGATDRPALVLLHGWPHSRALYDDVVEELGDAFLVLAMDLPDVGDSRGPPPSAEKSALADILLTAAENAGARDITIAGLDIGGMIAFAAARDHGERISRAIVMNTVIPGLEPWEALLADPHVWHFAFHAIADLPETLVRGCERVYFDFFHDALAGDPAKIPDALRETFAQAYSRPEALKAGFDWYRAMARDAERNASPKAISTPMLYVRGDADGRSIGSYRDGLKAAGVVNLDTRVVAGAGELLPIEAPAAFVEIIRDFAAGARTSDNVHAVPAQ